MMPISPDKILPKVWAIGGGKGGVGKSVITSSLGIALARKGKRCVLLDADLGGANLHTLMGVPYPKRTLTDFLLRKVSSLNDALMPTSMPNLSLISGSRAMLEMGNLHNAQKTKIIRQLFDLDADYILLDLGAGSTFNSLDFFLAAHERVMVVVPTPTSIENAYHFLKAAYYRQLKHAIRSAGAGKDLESYLEEKVSLGIRSPAQFMEHLSERIPKAAMAIRKVMQDFSPRLIVNQVQNMEEISLGDQMVVACRDFFGIEMGYLGNVKSDECVLRAIQMRRPVLEAFPGSPFVSAINGITRRLVGD